MYRLTSKLIIYRGIGEDSILRSLAETAGSTRVITTGNP